MNKEEIEKVKKHYIFTTKHELDKDNKRLKEYIQLLEQKSAILDRVTDKLNKNGDSSYQALTKIEYRLRKMNRKEYDTRGNGKYLVDLRDTLLNRIEYVQELLNIIEENK